MEFIQKLAVSAETYLRSLRDREEGQTFTEYALILSVVVLIAVAAYVVLGSKISSLVSTVADQL